MLHNKETKGARPEIDKKGRWDIDFIKTPRTKVTESVDHITKCWLIAISENHPEEWEELKRAIKYVDERLI